jgi:integrase
MEKRRPFLSPYKDRHGTLRWRYRRKGLEVAIPGRPGEEAFEAAYSAALEGKPKPIEIVRLPNAALPRTLRAAWRMHVQSAEWRALRQTSKDQYTNRAERLLAMPVNVGGTLTFSDVAVGELRRRHVKNLLAAMSDRPHSAADCLIMLRKMIVVALDEEWILHDPTHRLRYSPKIEGHRAWTDEERHKFEKHYPLGTMQRTIYALALYTGQRRGDLVRFRWADFETNQIDFVQQKTGKRLRLPVLAHLRAALKAAPRHGEYVLSTVKGEQRSAEGLTNDWGRWTERAGLTEGATIHGLRKTLGKLLAEQGATTRELMDALGHDAIAHAELYSREAEQEMMAKAAFGKVSKRLRPRLTVVDGDPTGEPSGDPRAKSLKK